MKLIVKTCIFVSILFVFCLVGNFTNNCYALQSDDYVLTPDTTFIKYGQTDTLRPTIENLSSDLLYVTKVIVADDYNNLGASLNDLKVIDTGFVLNRAGETGSKKEIRIFINLTTNPGIWEFFVYVYTSSATKLHDKTGLYFRKLIILSSNSEDWGKREVDPNAYIKKEGIYPFSPYLSEHHAITLRNDGTQTVTLSVPTIILDTNGSAFEIDINGARQQLSDPTTLFNVFNSLKLVPGEEKIFSVYFHPRKECLSELKIQFNSDADIPPISTLIGNGALPKSKTENLDFGTKLVGTVSVKKEVKFTNTEWECDYPLTISDFRTEVKGKTTFGNIGTNNIFRWNNMNIVSQDGNPVTLPVKLLPGEYITIKGEFEPTSNEYYEGSLITVSDAQEEAVSVWTGNGNITDILDDNSNNISGLRITPNPARDYIGINFERYATLAKCGISEVIQIFDMLGEIVLTVEQTSPSVQRIDIINLSPGIYFMKIGNKVEKFVKI